MIRDSKLPRLLALLMVFGLVAAACGDSDDDSAGSDGGADAPQGTEGEAAAGGGGGELIDLATFVGGPPEHLDPAVNNTLNAYQVINALYDGLTDVDASDPDDPRIVPHVAETVEPNEDATVWTFTIREGVTFSNGEPVLPSSFVRAWERATVPEFAGYYASLFNFIEGGAEKLAGEADSISGVEADDEAMTLTVRLSRPYANFDALAGFQTFFPMPSDVDDLGDQVDWENGIMIGNGPYVMEEPRTDQEIVLVRNDSWAGDSNGETHPDRPERIVFRVSADPDSAYNAFEAGEGDTGRIPPARVDQARSDHGNTLDVNILGSYHFVINDRDPRIGGEQNQLLRQAVSQAINRDEINEAIYNGIRTTSTGVVPRGIPGFEEGLCQYCGYDPEAAEADFQAWLEAGNSQTEPLPVQFNADAGHEQVVQIMIDNLQQVGIQAVAQPMPTETYFSELAAGACTICRAGWFADYPTYDNFLYNLFHTDSLGGNNFGYSNPEFDQLVDEAMATVDDDERASLFREAESLLLNEHTGVIPVNWYRGDYAFDQERITNFPQTNFGLILWEQVDISE